MSKKILMAVAIYYTSPFQVGSHHYARAFEKLGYEVLFLSNPISPMHKFFANSDEFKERERIYKKGGESIRNISYYVPNSLFTPQNKPILSSRFILNNWHNFTYPNLLNFIREQGFDEVDILWFDSPLFSFLLDTIKYKKSILRIADYSKGFASVSKNQFNTEIDIANKVDIVIYTAKNLKEKYDQIKDKSKMKYLPNGIDIDFFKIADKTLPQELKDIPEPRIIYVGAIHDWFDVDLVYYCAKKLQNYNFIIIGPEQKDLSKLKTLRNVYILGAMSYSRVPAFLYNCQVGIIPFDVKKYPDLVNSINPLKMYEYLACGLKVVSMRWEQISDMEKEVYLAHNKEEFCNFITCGNNIKYDLNKLAWTNILKEFLQDIESY